MSKNEPVSEAVTMTESNQIDSLVERSKADSNILVGSDIRWLSGIIRRLDQALKKASCPTVAAVMAYDDGQQDQASRISELEKQIGEMAVTNLKMSEGAKELQDRYRSLAGLIWLTYKQEFDAADDTFSPVEDQLRLIMTEFGKAKIKSRKLESTVNSLLESQKALKADDGCNTLSELAASNSKVVALTQEVQRLSFHLDTAREDLDRARAGEPRPDSGYSAWTKTKELRGFVGEDGAKKSKGFWSWLSNSRLFHRHKWVSTLVNLEVESGTTKMLSMCSHHCEGCGASKIKWVFPN